MAKTAQELREVIDNPKVINGLFKQAIFLSIPFSFNKNNKSYNFILKEVLESDIRKADIERSLIFLLSENANISNLITVNEADISFGLPNAIIRFSGSLKILTEHSIAVVFPKEIELIQQRVSKRLKLNAQFEPALYTDDLNQYEVGFQILDIDSNGIGAHIKCSSPDFLPAIGGIISGSIIINGSNFNFQKKITSISEKKENFFRVGLAEKSENDEQYPLNAKFRKRRFVVSATFDIQSPLTGKVYTVNLNDLSMGGFRGSVDGALAPEPMIVGLDYKATSYDLKFNLVRNENNYVSFKLVDGSQNDLVWWAKFVSKLTDSDIFTEVGRGEDLIRLFCESGAMASETLSRTTLYNQNFLNETSKDTSNDFWTFRWVNSLDAELVQGHVSSIRFSDSAWFIGDGAGGGSKESKINRTFIPRFFDAFMDFCKSVSPLPKIFFIWKKNHPYWSKFEQYLLSNRENQNFIGSYLIHFTKLDPTLNLIAQNDVVFTEINSYDIAAIANYSKIFSDFGLGEFIDSFDFRQSSFASPRLLDGFRVLKRSDFARRFYALEYKGTEALCIYTKLPHGSSLNQVMTSCFVLIKKQGDKICDDWEHISKLIHSHGTKIGICPSSIRRVESYNESFKIFHGEQGTSIGFLVYPDLLSFYRPIVEGKSL